MCARAFNRHASFSGINEWIQILSCMSAVPIPSDGSAPLVAEDGLWSAPDATMATRSKRSVHVHMG